MEKILNFVERLIAFIFLLISSPLLLIISLIVMFNMRSNPIFKQMRLGRNSTPFCIYKFRTLKPNAPSDVPTDAIADYSEYSTKIGLFLRATSLDELPQLINIIKGDMSFVGPRPVMLNEHELNSKRASLGIYNIRPGITGWSQINGRDMLEVDEKIRYDLEYLNNKSFKLDIYIIWSTFVKVLRKEGIKGTRTRGYTSLFFNV